MSADAAFKEAALMAFMMDQKVEARVLLKR